MIPWTDRPTHLHWLEAHARGLLEFGRGTVPDESGGRWLADDGSVDASQPVFTWLTGRSAHVFALGALLGVPGTRPPAQRAITALRTRLHDDDHGGWYASVGPDGTPDTTKSAYAHAFVVLAASTGTVAALDGAPELLADALAVLSERFWEPDAGMHADEWDGAWTRKDPYRGVNANMHSVEALLAATDATGDPRWAHRAATIAGRVVRWARDGDWRIPEHFDAAWAPQPELNRDRPDDQFKPYGATPGHGLEWSRLLLQVDATLAGAAPDATAGTTAGGGTGTDAAPGDPDLVAAAAALYDRAVRDGWAADGEPGFVYTTDWDGTPVVRTRMHWVTAEAIGAAAALHQATGDHGYAEDYERWWDYAAEHLLDHVNGSWHHELDPSNSPTATVWAGKPDLYHAFQAALLPALPLSPGLAVAVRDGLRAVRR
ncbi:AGE family epimerase/isomerase [Cellulomonas aerilata]|uniref:N-acyl-D-glucosamine 2-epimerase n=1 Tax=Cellulomonas aerilata TaxID=515326 RepID=A0A512DED0_9CELL|nr:AGE family epimerase/isomerase [Cellulomonas aerilata]GEO34815.1 N-acyl-D-glucosamine 2-epimerase [Cellulomonas aerilata]